MTKIGIIAATLAFVVSPALADEVVVHHDDDTTAKSVEKHVSGDGCASKTVRKENDAGDSKTVHKTNCD